MGTARLLRDSFPGQVLTLALALTLALTLTLPLALTLGLTLTLTLTPTPTPSLPLALTLTSFPGQHEQLMLQLDDTPELQFLYLQVRGRA